MCALLALWATSAFSSFSAFGTKAETRDEQVINSISLDQQVVLLSLGSQGISERDERTDFFGVDIPGSERISFIQYAFNAKLGIGGKNVSVEQTGENKFLISIPEFVFIGHDNESFRLAAENNGVLSWVTPEIDRVEMINNILNSDAKDQYLVANEEILQDQARVFYGSIIASIDPTIVTEFTFR